MQLISNITYSIIYQLLAKKYGKEYATITLNWQKIAGSKFHLKSCPQKLVFSKNFSSCGEATLYIRVYDPVISIELHFQRDILIERIAIYLGYTFIKNILISVSPSSFKKLNTQTHDNS